MGYLLVLLVAVLWSLTGTLVKATGGIFPPEIITFSRFFFGVLVLIPIVLLSRQKPSREIFKNKWIYIGAAGKCLNYFAENYGLSQGFSYGNIIVFPVQSILLILVSALILKEQIKAHHWVAIALCILGVGIISYNGLPLSVFFGPNFRLTLIFILSAIGAGFFLISQKMLLDQYTSGSMNLVMFSLGALIALPPAAAGIPRIGVLSLGPILALIATGVSTGVSFLLSAKAMQKIPFFWLSILQNSSVLFSLLWASLFFQEPITRYIFIGVVLFLCGMVVLNLPGNRGKKSAGQP